ncbi:unnamed protein product [Cladocopium goreaui]|uniref:Serine/threonine-protein kinase N2 (PKN gamma ) (Protein kinase C-like 2) (Protein-kinase C-related kinase 2) n=1 Tax=Cladocopium goreaui TaxID=2562237 RepID=A0A9P1FR90_9DINO|nr:unnamed protein product [Cladocopium goreaui]
MGPLGPFRLVDEALQVSVPSVPRVSGVSRVANAANAWLQHDEVPQSARALHRNFLEVAKYTETGPSRSDSSFLSERQEKPATEPYPENCRVELQPDEPRACEQPWVNWCQDECRVHYGTKKKALYHEKDREQCYNACISHCVMGRDAEGVVFRFPVALQDTPVDLWALGTFGHSPEGLGTVGEGLIYELLVGHAPFWGSVEEIRQKVLSVDIRYPPQLLSPEAVQLFHLLLRRDPHSRIPARQLLQENGWVQQGLEAFKAAGRTEAASPATTRDVGHRCLGASMVDTTLSRQKEILRSNRCGAFSTVVAPQISQPPTTPCAVPLSAALPNHMAAMQASAASSVLLKPRPLQVGVPGTTGSQVSLCGAVGPSLCFLGTAR